MSKSTAISIYYREYVSDRYTMATMYHDITIGVPFAEVVEALKGMGAVQVKRGLLVEPKAPFEFVRRQGHPGGDLWVAISDEQATHAVRDSLISLRSDGVLDSWTRASQSAYALV